MIDYGTEAEHLADIDDYDLEEAYEDWERSYTLMQRLVVSQKVI